MHLNWAPKHHKQWHLTTEILVIAPWWLSARHSFIDAKCRPWSHKSDKNSLEGDTIVVQQLNVLIFLSFSVWRNFGVQSNQKSTVDAVQSLDFAAHKPQNLTIGQLRLDNLITIKLKNKENIRLKPILIYCF